MPKYLEYEEQYGSVTAGLIATARQAAKNGLINEGAGGARYSAFVSLDRGMQVMTERLAELVGPGRINCNSELESINRSVRGGWELAFNGGKKEVFDKVILAVPTAIASRLLESVDASLAEAFAKIRYASSAVACLLFPRQTIEHALDGFGFVVPAREKSSILAGSFASIKFANRCPSDHVLVRVFLGGALKSLDWQLGDNELLRMAIDGLSPYINLKGRPERSWLKRWPDSMPQYDVGHLSLAKSIDNALVGLEGLFYAGAGLRGVGIPDCVTSGEEAAYRVTSDRHVLHS